MVAPFRDDGSALVCETLWRRLQWPHLDHTVCDRTRGLRDEADRLLESGGLDDRKPGDWKAQSS
jgi:hypothetical protein